MRLSLVIARREMLQVADVVVAPFV
jgi:hypothetical protein